MTSRVPQLNSGGRNYFLGLPPVSGGSGTVSEPLPAMGPARPRAQSPASTALYNSFCFAKLFLGRRSLFVPVIMIAVTSPATDFGGGSVHQGNDRVVGQAAAFDAVIINYVAQSRGPALGSL